MEDRQEGNKPKQARIFTQAWACMQDRQRPNGTSCLRGGAGDFQIGTWPSVLKQALRGTSRADLERLMTPTRVTAGRFPRRVTAAMNLPRPRRAPRRPRGARGTGRFCPSRRMPPVVPTHPPCLSQRVSRFQVPPGPVHVTPHPTLRSPAHPISMSWAGPGGPGDAEALVTHPSRCASERRGLPRTAAHPGNMAAAPTAAPVAVIMAA